MYLQATFRYWRYTNLYKDVFLNGLYFKSKGRTVYERCQLFLDAASWHHTWEPQKACIGDASEEKNLQERSADQWMVMWCLTVFVKTKPRNRRYGLSAASISYGTMWGVCAHLTDIHEYFCPLYEDKPLSWAFFCVYTLHCYIPIVSITTIIKHLSCIVWHSIQYNIILKVSTLTPEKEGIWSLN